MNSGVDCTIMHVDMDAFFSSVEELADPSLKGKPVVVAGPAERSIITTASYPARSYGIRTGMTVGQARVLCRNLVLLRADYRKYSDSSRKVMAVLESFTPDVMAASVDEAFLDTGSVQKRYGGPLKMGALIKGRVKEFTGLTCSIGIAGSRILAKLASGMEKPDGLTMLDPGNVDALLERTPVGKMCGIGPVTERALHDMGIKTCGQLGRYPEELLMQRFGSQGKKLAAMGRGQGDGFWSLDPTGAPGGKSIGHSVTLPEDIRDRQSMGCVLQTLSEMVGRRARRHQCRGKILTLTWRYDDFTTRTKRTTLGSPVNLTDAIYRGAMKLLGSVEIQRPVRLLGISLSDLSVEAYTPHLLEEDARKEEVQKALDTINDRFGEFTLAYGDTLGELRSRKVISPAWRSGGIRESF